MPDTQRPRSADPASERAPATGELNFLSIWDFGVRHSFPDSLGLDRLDRSAGLAQTSRPARPAASLACPMRMDTAWTPPV